MYIYKRALPSQAVPRPRCIFFIFSATRKPRNEMTLLVLNRRRFPLFHCVAANRFEIFSKWMALLLQPHKLMRIPH